MYYAATNSYATSTSMGFYNTWFVLGFATRAMRDVYVHSANDLATRAITRAEIRKYGGKIGQISYYDKSGDFHEHMGQGEFCSGYKRFDSAVVTWSN